MPAYVRGYVVCETCHASANAPTAVGQAWNKADFRWELPEGWILYNPKGHGTVRVYCSSACNTKSAVMGYPDQTGCARPASEFDERTIDQIYEMVETGMRKGAGADAVLSAMEAVLIAWRKAQVTT